LHKVCLICHLWLWLHDCRMRDNRLWMLGLGLISKLRRRINWVLWRPPIGRYHLWRLSRNNWWSLGGNLLRRGLGQCLWERVFFWVLHRVGYPIRFSSKAENPAVCNRTWLHGAECIGSEVFLNIDRRRRSLRHQTTPKERIG